jgi:hypothetical protein
LIELPPSQSRPRSSQFRTDDDNGRLTFWMIAGMLFISIIISGNSMQKLTKEPSIPTHNISLAVQEDAVARSPHGIGTD